ncbi:MAG: 4-alpha-glucanotransferase [Streptococcaceae bacterium]|jgi:4-alpha-glucanotransferase|nr:4-alpha-glucanotransferase [Streptococcaceae bacterium]
MAENFRISPYGDKPYHTGTAIPVFSLRSQHSAGVGQFSDLKAFADYLAATGQDVLQLLPINDTTTYMDWRDSYPYRSVSVFALHPIYLDIEPFLPQLSVKDAAHYVKEAKALNDLPEVDYEASLALKWNYATLAFEAMFSSVKSDKAYQDFVKAREFWLKPYAIFCYLRDTLKTADFSQWGNFVKFDSSTYDILKASGTENFENYYNLQLFVQYELHVQLSESVAYAHSLGIAIKGDIGIGIAHDSADAWSNPALYHMDMSAGAPPDVFSESGQNWGFPTYNWEEMAKDDYAWWKARLSTMSQYFDAYRLDHILGFFRIWEIPKTSVRGLLGQFSPAIGLTPEEIENYYGIPLRAWGEDRFTKPFIKDWVIDEIFGRDERDRIIQSYLTYSGSGNYALASKFDTEVKVEKVAEEADKHGLYQLLENIIFLKDHREPDRYHPRIKLFETSSYREFGDAYRKKLYTLYEVYYYQRNNDFWQQEALKKLPVLTQATDMLPCGEDLGMVPDNVPDTMWQLKILRLILERMPADDSFVNSFEFAPYLSVLTTSSHDTSNLRAFWWEDRAYTQRYYNEIMGWEGAAPNDATPEIIQNIVGRALNSPAMIVSLPLSDWLALTQNERRDDPLAERINVPDEPFHYWRYRMHLTIEDLLENTGFTTFLKDFIAASRRIATK